MTPPTSATAIRAMSAEPRRILPRTSGANSLVLIGPQAGHSKPRKAAQMSAPARPPCTPALVLERRLTASPQRGQEWAMGRSPNDQEGLEGGQSTEEVRR